MTALVSNKKETDRNHIETVNIMNAFQASMNNVSIMMAKLNKKQTDMANGEEIQFSSQDTPQLDHSPMWDSFDDPDDNEADHNNTEASHLQNYSSDADMEGAADEK